MKKYLYALLSVSILLFSQHLVADDCDYLVEAQEEMNDLYSTGCGCEDGIFNAVSASMIGWGLALFAGIALIAGLVHQSAGPTVHADNAAVTPR